MTPGFKPFTGLTVLILYIGRVECVIPPSSMLLMFGREMSQTLIQSRS